MEVPPVVRKIKFLRGPSTFWVQKILLLRQSLLWDPRGNYHVMDSTLKGQNCPLMKPHLELGSPGHSLCSIFLFWLSLPKGRWGYCKRGLSATDKCSLQSHSSILNGQPVNLRSRSWIWMLCTEHLFSKKTWFCLRVNGDSLIVIKLGWWLKLDVTKWKSPYKTWDAYHRPSVNNI